MLPPLLNTLLVKCHILKLLLKMYCPGPKPLNLNTSLGDTCIRGVLWCRPPSRRFSELVLRWSWSRRRPGPWRCRPPVLPGSVRSMWPPSALWRWTAACRSTWSGTCSGRRWTPGCSLRLESLWRRPSSTRRRRTAPRPERQRVRSSDRDRHWATAADAVHKRCLPTSVATSLLCTTATRKQRPPPPTPVRLYAVRS